MNIRKFEVTQMILIEKKNVFQNLIFVRLNKVFFCFLKYK